MKKLTLLTILFVFLLSLTGCSKEPSYPTLDVENDNGLETRNADSANLEDIKQNIKDEKYVDMQNALINAINNGYLESVKYLVENNTSVNASNNTSLFIAVMNNVRLETVIDAGHLEVAKYIRLV